MLIHADEKREKICVFQRPTRFCLITDEVYYMAFP